ncbi:hypothetical protein [Billgrantia endophytica]|uniref:Uncharacterized protein n=1 Tax=Billgrantia endophytica TaxID=2033802 RepID=A0A2N7UB61_9GAMM|nr:hypothetical protein [Halomonas endophytica]PMR77631.1 hypothetical protein C1H69_01755 [Halomonas endophytica]
MTEAEHRRIIEELESLIRDTRHTLERFEATGMDERMPADYDKLLVILDRAVKDQRAHTLEMLS